MKNQFTAFALLVALASPSAFAASAKTKTKTTETTETTETTRPTSNRARSADSTYVQDDVPWGMAGCSIWNWAIEKKERGPQVAVWVLEHFILGVQTFAISSGTSNCVDPTVRMTMNEQETFVSVNLASLQKEAAQGSGEHLDTLAEIFGCSEKEGFAEMSQGRYDAIFSDEKPENVVRSYKSELKAAGAVCSRAS